jgi:16S rRNA (guanine1207-N2)-methyltransferase
MQANGLTADIIASNGLENVEGQFDAIISNPPFHTGVKTDYGIADKFIAQSRQYLVKGGELRIVANRFLPYPDILEAEFGNVQTIAQSNRFAVYASIKRA